MTIKTIRAAAFRSALFIGLCAIGASCAPKVTSFTAHPAMMITRHDSVWFNWQVSGTPVLLFSSEDADDDDNPGKLYLNYKLVAHKSNKDAFATIMLTLLRDSVTDYIGIDTRRSGDSAIAIATKDTTAWGVHFFVDSMSSSARRPLTVTHGGRTALLDAAGTMSGAFRDLPNSGPWEIRTLLTAEEKKDTSLIPGSLRIKTRLVYRKG